MQLLLRTTQDPRPTALEADLHSQSWRNSQPRGAIYGKYASYTDVAHLFNKILSSYCYLCAGQTPTEGHLAEGWHPYRAFAS